MERTRQDLVLGLVFFGALGLLMWATIQLTGLSFTAQTQPWRIYFANVAGLRVGDNVFVLGHRMGSVTRIAPNREATAPEEALEVTVLLDEPVTMTDAYSVMIEQGTLLGGVQVQINPGTGPDIIPEDRVLRGSVRVGGLDAVGELFSDEQLKGDLRAILSGIREAVDRINAGESTIGKLFSDPALYDEAVGAVRSARRTLEGIERGEGAVGRLMSDPSLGEDVAGTLRNLRSVTGKLDGNEGLIGRLIGDPAMGAEGRQIVSDVAAVTGDLRAGRGTIGALLSDAEMAQEVRRITAGFADLAENVNDPSSGLVGELVAGKATRDRFASFVADLSDISTSIRAGNGLAGRLIYDEELGEQFSRMLNQVSRAIEDAREAAPVGTFFQVISGAF